MTTGKITHAIAIYEMENGKYAAAIYGTEGTAAECYDYIMAKAADGKTLVKYGGGTDEFILAMGELIERRRAASDKSK